MVRYLRNALMTKLGGEQTELLQIRVTSRPRSTDRASLHRGGIDPQPADCSAHF